MSAIITSTTDTEIEMLADGLLYELDGTITAQKQKIYVSERLPLAINVRGPDDVGKLLVMGARFMELAGTFDAVLKSVSESIEEHREKFAQLPIAEITICGIMNCQPTTWRGYTHDFGEQKAGTFWLHGDRYVGGAMGEPDDAEWTGWGVVPGAPDGVLRREAVAIMERLRSLPGQVYGVEDGPDVYGVGGHVQYVRIGADGSVTNEIIHQWDDEVGQKVAPRWLSGEEAIKALEARESRIDDELLGTVHYATQESDLQFGAVG